MSALALGYGAGHTTDAGEILYDEYPSYTIPIDMPLPYRKAMAKAALEHYKTAQRAGDQDKAHTHLSEALYICIGTALDERMQACWTVTWDAAYTLDIPFADLCQTVVYCRAYLHANNQDYYRHETILEAIAKHGPMADDETIEDRAIATLKAIDPSIQVFPIFDINP
jgi:hypothetical protein